MTLPAAVLLSLAALTGASVQEPSRPPAAPPARVEVDAREVREQLAGILAKYPPEVGRILKMDPTMLGNGEYLAQYPALQQFLASHPEILRNPAFYLASVQLPYEFIRPADPNSRALDMWDSVIEGVSVFAVLVFVSSMVAWLIKTVLGHRRWLRTSRVQTEVHNKLLDRFAGTNELLAYVQSPAGRRFLEAAPIPVDAPSPGRPVAAPLNRVLWSIQAGIVLAVGGFGFQYVSRSVIEEVSQGIWTIGVLAVAFGIGFILAGAFSYVMSRRLGLLEPPPPAPGEAREDAPLV